MQKLSTLQAADVKCEFCGNRYGSQFIEFHKRNRCTKSLFFNDLQPSSKENSNQKPEAIYQVSEKTFQSKNETIHKLQPDKVTQKSFSVPTKKHKQFVRCIQCNINVREGRYQTHIAKKCPARNRPSKKGRFRIKLKEKTTLKTFPISPRKEENTFSPVIKNKKRCSKCGTIYLAEENQCPECLHLIEIRRNSIRCNHCEGTFTKDKIENHLQKYCPKIEVKCPKCEEKVFRGELQIHISFKHKIPQTNAIRDEAKFRAFISQYPPLKNQTKTKTKTKTKKAKNKVSFRRRTGFQTGVCYHCGRPAMYASTACYNCGDK